MEKLKKSLKTRSLTKNEKVLLSLLGIVIFIWGIFSFVLTPQAEKLQTLEAEKIQYESEILENTIALKKEREIDQEWRILDTQRNEILSHYFPTLDQAQIIYLLNDLLEEDSVEINDMNFSRPTMESFGELEAKQMSINIPFSGNYDGIMNIIKSMNYSPRRIALDRINIDQNGNSLSGNMDLKIYSLEGIAEANPDIIYIDQASNDGMGVPFLPYASSESELAMEDGSLGEGSLEDIDDSLDPSFEDGYEVFEEKPAVLLHDFETNNYNFIPSSPLVKGSAMRSTRSKSGNYSLRFEYNILGLERINRAYVDLSKPNIEFKIPPSSIGIWINSYGYSPGTLGMTLKGQAGEKLEINLAEGISWMGWEYIETYLPADLKLYPLTLDNIYFEIPQDRDDYGVLLLDKLEAFYPETEDEEEETDSEINDFYVVKVGDSITKISQEKYGTPHYKNEIMELNDIKPGQALPVGKVLVLKRH